MSLKLAKDILKKLKEKYVTEYDKYFLKEVSGRWLKKDTLNLFFREIITNFLHFEKEDFDEINKICSVLIENGYDRYLNGSVYYSWAIFYASIGDYSQAEELLKEVRLRGFEKHILTQDKNLKLYMDEKRVSQILGITNVYEAHFEQELLDDDVVEEVERLINVLIHKYEKYSEYLKFKILKYLKDRRVSSIIKYLLGFCYSNQEFELIDKIMRLTNDYKLDPVNYYFWAVYFAKTGDKKNSELNLKKAIERGYKNIKINEIDERLTKLLGKAYVNKLLKSS